MMSSVKASFRGVNKKTNTEKESHLIQDQIQETKIEEKSSKEYSEFRAL